MRHTERTSQPVRLELYYRDGPTSPILEKKGALLTLYESYFVYNEAIHYAIRNTSSGRNGASIRSVASDVIIESTSPSFLI
jgi:hypothetical protein